MTSEPEENSDPIDSEQKKYLVDLFKHQTTLCTATIILTMAVVGNFLPQPMPAAMKKWIGLSLGTLLLSLLISFVSLIELVNGIENYKSWKRWMYSSFMSFVFGIVILAFIILFG